MATGEFLGWPVCPRCGAILVLCLYHGLDGFDHEFCKTCCAVLRTTLVVHVLAEEKGTKRCL